MNDNAKVTKYGSTIVGFLVANLGASVIVYGHTIAHGAAMEGKASLLKMISLFVHNFPNVLPFFLSAMALTWLPCSLLSCLPLKIRKNLFFLIMAGMLLGLFSITTIVQISSRFTFYSDPLLGHHDSQYFFESEIIFAISGALSGILFWLIAARTRAKGTKDLV